MEKEGNGVKFAETETMTFIGEAFSNFLEEPVIDVPMMAQMQEYLQDEDNLEYVLDAFESTQSKFQKLRLELTLQGIQIKSKRGGSFDTGVMIQNAEKARQELEVNKFFFQDFYRRLGSSGDIELERALHEKDKKNLSLKERNIKLERRLNRQKKTNKAVNWVLAKSSLINFTKAGLAAAVGLFFIDKITTSPQERWANDQRDQTRLERVLEIRNVVESTFESLDGKVDFPINIKGIEFRRLNESVAFEDQELLKEDANYGMKGEYNGDLLHIHIRYDHPNIFLGENETLQTDYSLGSIEELENWLEIEKESIDARKKKEAIIVAEQRAKQATMDKKLKDLGLESDGTIRIGELVFTKSSAGAVGIHGGVSSSGEIRYLTDHYGYKLSIEIHEDVPEEFHVINSNLELSAVVKSPQEVEAWIREQLNILETRKDGVWAQIKVLKDENLYGRIIYGTARYNIKPSLEDGTLSSNADWLESGATFRFGPVRSPRAFGIQVAPPHDFIIDNENFGPEITPSLRRAMTRRLDD